MPNIKSQAKRLKQAEKRQQRNRAVKSATKTCIASFNESCQGKDKNKAQEALKKAVKTLDKAAAKKIIHKNQAANRKSRLTKKLNALT